MHTLNIGILAHVDAGKTSLTERLLFDHGAIDRLGSVDAGDTRTDDGWIERRRGITVRSAVAALTVGGTQINLIDTPGHCDFIAEVERALEVLDGAVLLLSAVEGVQAQTRVLMRTLRRLRLPTLVFVNKIDRAGARSTALLADIHRRLTPSAAALTDVSGLGTPGARVTARPAGDARLAEALAEVDADVLAALVDGPGATPEDLRRALAARTADGSFHPVLFGSALGGQGVAELVDALVRLVPPAHDFGIEADFAPGRVRFLERPRGVGEACAEMPWHLGSRVWATVGLRVEPGPRGGGGVFAYDTELGALPRAFHQAVEDSVHTGMLEGLSGAQVTDYRVTLIRSGFSSVMSTAGDFRTLTPVVLRRALEGAGTGLYEPCHAFETEVPLDALAPVTAQLAQVGAEFTATSGGSTSWVITGEVPARRVREVELRLPGLTHGEGVWWSRPSGDRELRP
ncbi:GTP-binding protein [Streptomyces sp. CdTB01]|uniref:GTP-binding protein n=1 Tax=Streptomyces sp. CdTB01 TaxID=1725411 RepID=UPI00073A69E1|nr:GTP-binding protein [Streptomyces sp. CdTB01]ALV31726.1 GTP-binding protein [Streptomyces sp. CdTB01]